MEERVQSFVSDHLGLDSKRVATSKDLFFDCRFHGDDCAEFLADFAQEFGVNMDGFLWYFHFEEEGWNYGSLLFKAPSDRVARIPLTLDLLIASAHAAQWLIVYPEHRLPARRYDLWLNLMITAGIALVLMYFIAR